VVGQAWGAESYCRIQVFTPTVLLVHRYRFQRQPPLLNCGLRDTRGISILLGIWLELVT